MGPHQPPRGRRGQKHRKNLAAYRSLLVQTAQKAQDDYDKAVTALSGGAIRLSLTFLKGCGRDENARGCHLVALRLGKLGFSVAMVLLSFYAGHLALQNAIKQVARGTIHSQRPGGILCSMHSAAPFF